MRSGTARVHIRGGRARLRLATRTTAALAAALVSGLAAAPAHANNGLKPIGYSAGTVALGGADTALATDITTINANPAGLARLGRGADVYGAAAHALDVRHRDEFGNDRGVANNVIGFAGGGYAHPVAGTPLTLGIGLFYQGGTGSVFKDVRTAFGTRDGMASLFTVVRVAPALAWRLDEQWSIGASLGINQAEAEQRLFPGTSFASGSTSFFGYDFKGAKDTAIVPTFGLAWEPTPALRLGLAYAGRAKFDLRGNNMRVNFDAIGAGTVAYRDVRLEGVALPRQVDAGVAWQVTQRLAVVGKLAWLEWSRALRTSTLTATGADAAGVPDTLNDTARLDWRNQWVVAGGLSFAADDRLTMMAGANYGRNPVPRDTTSPLFAEIGRWHLTTGATLRLTDGYRATAALEYQLLNQAKYTNPQTPFGSDAGLTSRYVALHLLISKRWN
jgi:long-chain fatty acid transport protein